MNNSSDKSNLRNVVLLGAGASVAACKFDKNGVQVPLMNQMSTCIPDLNNLLKNYGFTEEQTGNFEYFYARLSENEKNKELISSIERIITDFFSRSSYSR